jgi:hypothetical protein
MKWEEHVARMGERRVAKGFSGETRDHLEDPGGNGRIMLKWIVEKWVGWVMDWIDLAQDRDRWRAVVNLRVP